MFEEIMNSSNSSNSSNSNYFYSLANLDNLESLAQIEPINRFPFLLNSNFLGIDKVEINFYALENHPLLLKNTFTFLFFDEEDKENGNKSYEIPCHCFIFEKYTKKDLDKTI